MSTISVLISVYISDNPKYFDLAMQSIWTDQYLKPDEIILVEDGPLTINLNSLIHKWKDIIGPQLKILKNNINIGLTKSLNKGLKIATGDYIARMDSDDISLPYRFKEQVKFLDFHPEIMVVGGDLQEFNHETDNLNTRIYPKTHAEILNYISKASPLAHPTVMMRRKIFDNGLMYDERYKTSQDIKLWFDVLSKGYKIANLDEITLKFRRDGDIFRRRSREKAKNEFIIYMKGIHNLYGSVTFRYVYPIVRYLFRMMPVFIIKAIYSSKLRHQFLQ